jgi:hypothetical protein
MGEAKRRRITQAERLAAAKGCIYCAHAAPATTLDHMPPRSVFAGKLRPQGLEFPCCEACNTGTATTDQVAALMSRILPGSTTDTAKAEIRKYLQGVSNNVPGLLEEMAGTPEWHRSVRGRVPAGTHALRVSGPIVSEHLERFAAKFGFAMHAEFTGQPIGPGGAVAARWYSNADALDGSFPADAWDIVGPPETLRRGKIQVGDQFEYAYAVGEDGTFGMFLGTFRQSFAVLAFTTTAPRSVFDSPPTPIRLWRPGCFKSA